MCKGCSMDCGTEFYLNNIMPLRDEISNALSRYEQSIRLLPEANKHHKAIVRLRKKINNELNSWEVKKSK